MADYDDSNDRYVENKPQGLIGKPKEKSGSMFDWFSKRSLNKKAPAAETNPNSDLEIDPQGAKSLKDAFK